MPLSFRNLNSQDNYQEFLSLFYSFAFFITPSYTKFWQLFRHFTYLQLQFRKSKACVSYYNGQTFIDGVRILPVRSDPIRSDPILILST